MDLQHPIIPVVLMRLTQITLAMQCMLDTKIFLLQKIFGSFSPPFFLNCPMGVFGSVRLSPVSPRVKLRHSQFYLPSPVHGRGEDLPGSNASDANPGEGNLRPSLPLTQLRLRRFAPKTSQPSPVHGRGEDKVSHATRMLSPCSRGGEGKIK